MEDYKTTQDRLDTQGSWYVLPLILSGIVLVVLWAIIQIIGANDVIEWVSEMV